MDARCGGEQVKEHRYQTNVTWTGNNGDGTKTYRSYRRDHVISAAGKPEIPGSSDPAFRGDATRYNPEDLLVAAASGCHMLSYLHLCAVNGITVLEYVDAAEGKMQQSADGSGRFVSATLRPKITITPESDAVKARELHHEAHRMCFIANSLNFPVEIDPVIEVTAPTSI
jgi:organic hydroperoxide reductase OsmC/OhrA